MPSGGAQTRRRRANRNRNRRKLAAINAKITAAGGLSFKTLTQYYRRPRVGLAVPISAPVVS